jgi:Domain of unknown function (DUF4345)
MTFIQIINSIGAIATIGMGCLGFFAPHTASKMTGLTAINKTAFAEFRATFGGMFIAMGLIPLLTSEPLAYFMAGTIWISAAFGRFVSVILDRGYQEKKNLGGIAFEASFGLLMLAGSPFLTRV